MKIRDASSGQPIKSDIFIKHCVTNTIDEFVLRCERGQATGPEEESCVRLSGKDLAIREANNYKYAIDLFLMYASQGLTPNIQTNSVIAKKASEVKADLLSNPKIKAAQDKIDEYYNRKFKEIQKGYVSSVVKQLELTHIDKLNTKELKKFNAQFFKKIRENHMITMCLWPYPVYLRKITSRRVNIAPLVFKTTPL